MRAARNSGPASAIRRGVGLSGLALVLLLQGCATRPPEEAAKPVPPAARDALLASLSSWSAEGRVGVQVGQRGYPLGFQWRQEKSADKLRITDPLGRTAMLLEQNPQGARVRFANGQEAQGKTLHEVLAQRSPLPLPIESFAYWIQGRPAPDQPLDLVKDEQGLPARLRQGTWTVEYQGYQRVNGVDMPERLTVLGPNEVKVKVLVHQWTLHFGSTAPGTM